MGRKKKQAVPQRLDKKEKQEIFSDIAKAVESFTEQLPKECYSLDQAEAEINRLLLELNKKTSIISNILSKIDHKDQERCNALSLEQKQHEQKKAQALEDLKYIKIIRKLVKKILHCLNLISKLNALLKEFFSLTSSPSINHNIRQEIEKIKKDCINILSDYKEYFAQKIESVEFLKACSDCLSKEIEIAFQCFPKGKKKSFKNLSDRIEDIEKLFESFRDDLTYDQYDLLKIQLFLQEALPTLPTFTEGYQYITILAVFIYQAIVWFLESQPVNLSIDKLVCYHEPVISCSWEQNLLKELFFLKQELNKINIEFINTESEENNVLIEIVPKKLNPLKSMLNEILLINEKINSQLKIKEFYNQVIKLEMLFSIKNQNDIQELILFFEEILGIEGQKVKPRTFNLKNMGNITAILSYFLFVFEDPDERKEFLKNLSLLMTQFNFPKKEEIDFRELTIQNIVYLGQAFIATYIYFDVINLSLSLEKKIICQQGKFASIFLLRYLKEFFYKKQQVEKIKNEFLNKKYQSEQDFFGSKNEVLDEFTLLLSLVSNLLAVLDKQQSALLLENRYHSDDNGDILDLEGTCFLSFWNDKEMNLPALQAHLEQEQIELTQQQENIHLQLFMSNKKTKKVSFVRSPHTFLSLDIQNNFSKNIERPLLNFKRNLEKIIEYLQSISSLKLSKKEEDDFSAKLSSTLGQLQADLTRLLEQIKGMAGLPIELTEKGIMPLLRLERLYQFILQDAMEVPLKIEPERRTLLLDILNQCFSKADQISIYIEELTKKYSELNQEIKELLDKIESCFTKKDPIRVDNKKIKKLEAILLQQRPYELQTIWLEKLIRIVIPDRWYLLDSLFLAIKQSRKYEQWILVIKKQFKTEVKKKSVQNIADEKKPFSSQDKVAKLNKQEVKITPKIEKTNYLQNHEKFSLNEQQKKQFILWSIEFEQWRLEKNKYLQNIFQWIERDLISLPEKKGIMLFKILQAQCQILYENEKEFDDECRKANSWLGESETRPIHRRFEEQKYWFKKMKRLSQLYMDRLNSNQQTINPDNPDKEYPPLNSPELFPLLNDLLKINLEIKQIEDELKYKKEQLEEWMKTINRFSSQALNIQLPRLDDLESLFAEIAQLECKLPEKYQEKDAKEKELIEKGGEKNFLFFDSRMGISKERNLGFVLNKAPDIQAPATYSFLNYDSFLFYTPPSLPVFDETCGAYSLGGCRPYLDGQ